MLVSDGGDIPAMDAARHIKCDMLFARGQWDSVLQSSRNKCHAVSAGAEFYNALRHRLRGEHAL